MTLPADAKPPSRHELRKIETRGRLLAAARTLLARQGVDATRINEITDEADVGFGSFYNYFESKTAIAAAVAEAVADELGKAITASTTDVADAAEVLAIAHRTIIERAAEDPDIGWLMVRLEISHDLVSTALGPYVLRDLQRGIDDGRFTIHDTAATLIALGGALLGVVRAVLQGRAGPNAAAEHAIVVLQLLGVPLDDAIAVAERPLPPGG
ncbi:MAG: TetR/AcrR family transcriptional regulator [Patulibacter sp.]